MERVIAAFMTGDGIAPGTWIAVSAKSISTLKDAVWTARCAAA